MSMEEYRCTYAKEFFEAAIHDEQMIIKDTRNLVDPDIFLNQTPLLQEEPVTVLMIPLTQSLRSSFTGIKIIPTKQM